METIATLPMDMTVTAMMTTTDTIQYMMIMDTIRTHITIMRITIHTMMIMDTTNK
jgi:hypothetical protein